MRVLWVLIVLVLFARSAFADENKTLKIYHDADWINNVASSEAIWRGMDVALSEVEYRINGVGIELVKKNHSGNVTRSLGNMKAFLADDAAIAVVSGMHSPPLITNREFINENKIPVLVPWAAGAPITRYPSPENSVFRLSVDDTKAAEVMVEHAVSEYKCSKPYLFLENTPWGDSNARTIKTALDKRGMSSVGVKRFDWSMKSHVARGHVLDVVREGAECIIMVASAAEGAEIALAMSELKEENRIPLISHWGITGGNFHEIVDAQTRDKIDLCFIQSCFSFTNETQTPLSKAVFNNLQTLYPKDIENPKDLKSPVGFIHAYDLTKLFIAALEAVELSGDIQTDRDALKVSLETLEAPVRGLIKTYKTPFSKFSKSNPDAHEALGRKDLCMGGFTPNNVITLTHKSGYK